MSDEAWDRELTDRAKHELAALDDYAQDRIVRKLDDIVTDEWREPTEYLEPLQGVPHQKLRVGPFRPGCRANRETQIR